MRSIIAPDPFYRNRLKRKIREAIKDSENEGNKERASKLRKFLRIIDLIVY